MQLLLNSANAVEGVIGDGSATEITGNFHTTLAQTVKINLTGTTIGTVTMQHSTSSDGTYVSYDPAGTAVSITAEGIYSYDLPGGLYWHLTGNATTNAISVYVDGPHINLV